MSLTSVFGGQYMHEIIKCFPLIDILVETHSGTPVTISLTVRLELTIINAPPPLRPSFLSLLST